MKIVYATLSLIAGLVVLLLLAAALLPKEFSLQAETTINLPQQQVRDYVKLIKNQENYSVRVMADPNVTMTYTGTDGQIGFVAGWESDMKNVGIGEQEITAIDEGNSYTVEIRFQKPMQATNYATTRLEKVSDTETKVTSTFSGHTAFPMNLFSYFFSGIVKKDMQQNVDNLKKVLEE